MSYYIYKYSKTGYQKRLWSIIAKTVDGMSLCSNYKGDTFYFIQRLNNVNKQMNLVKYSLVPVRGSPPSPATLANINGTIYTLASADTAHIDFDGKYIWMAWDLTGLGYYEEHSLNQLDMKGNLIKKRDFGVFSTLKYGMCIDGKQLYILTKVGVVKQYDIINNKIIRSITLTNASNGLGFDGKYFWSMDSSKNVYCYNRDGKIMKSFPIGIQGKDIKCYGEDLWICA